MSVIKNRPRVLITGGAGFIGSTLVRKYHDKGWHVVVADSLTYAGFRHNLRALEGSPQVFQFIRADLRDHSDVVAIFQEAGPFNLVIHAAAESSVDRSIAGYEEFVSTNVLGSCHLFDVCRAYQVPRVINFATDEIFGHLDQSDPDPFSRFNESDPIQPRNIYSASKAAQYMMARAFEITHKVPIITVCPSNCYGPRQHAEKLIPKIIWCAINKKAMPIYNDGQNIREWLYVDDAAEAIFRLSESGTIGEIYNIGAGEQASVMQIYDQVCKLLVGHGITRDQMVLTQKPARKGDDFRYSVNSDKLRSQTKWLPQTNLSEGLEKTVIWYMSDQGRAYLSYSAMRVS